jgi:hypothetical protein
MVICRPKPLSSIQNGANKPRHTPPYLGRASCPCVPAKVKTQAEAGEMDRTRPAQITLPRWTKALPTAIFQRTKLHVLNVKRALKRLQLQPSAPELDERQTGPRENQSLNLFHRRKALQVTLVSSREQQTEMSRGFLGALRPQEQSGRKRNRYHSEHRHNRRNMFLRCNDLWRGCLCCRRHVATHKNSEQQNEPFVHR